MKRIVLLIILAFMLTGCGELPMPETTIKPPTVERHTTTELESKISLLLPEGTQLLTKENGNIMYDPISVNMGTKEGDYLLIFYGLAYKNKCLGAMVIDKEAYEPLWGYGYSDDSGYGISNYQLVDIVKDSSKELILEVSYYGLPKFIVINDFEEVLPLYTIESNRFEVLEGENEKPTLAIWVEITTDTYYIELIRWEVDHFILDTYNHPNYYDKLINAYKKRYDAFGGEGTVFEYYYGEILMKAGHYEESVQVIEHYLSSQQSIASIYQMKAGYVLGRSLYELGDNEGAMVALERALEQPDYYLDKLIESILLLAQIYDEMGREEDAVDMAASSNAYIRKYRERDYKYDMWSDYYIEAVGQIIAK